MPKLFQHSWDTIKEKDTDAYREYNAANCKTYTWLF